MGTIRRAWLMLAFGGLLSSLCAAVFSGDEAAMRFSSFAAPIIIILAGLVALGTLMRDPVNLFSPVGPCSVACIAYYGIGALAPAIADLPTSISMRLMYDFSNEELIREHKLAGFGIFILATVAYLCLARRPADPLTPGLEVDVPRFRRAVLTYYVIGMFITVTLTVPYQIGIIPAPPAAFTQLGRLLTFAIFMMGFGLSRNLLPRAVFFPLFLSGLGVLVGGGLISLSKYDTFTQLGAGLGGFILARPSRRMIGLTALGIGVAFVILTPLIVVARQVSDVDAPSFSARLEATFRTAKAGQELLEEEDLPNLPLVRISYVNGFTWAMREYDEGRAGTSLTDNVFWLFVPRAVWPSKPQVSNTGYYINELTTQSDIQSSAGITSFGEGYWNGGIVGLVLLSTAIGLILGTVTGISFDALTTMDPAKMIFVWTGAIMAFRIDGFFVVDYLGQGIILVLTYALLRVVLAVSAIDLETSEVAAA